MTYRLCLSRNIVREILAHARREWPNECCGLLAGTLEQGDGQVIRCYPLINEAASPTEFLSEPRSLFDAFKDMRHQQLELLAIFHSHPSSPAIPSQKDLERNFSEEVINVIVSLRDIEAVVRAWWLTAHDYQEAELMMEADFEPS